MSEITLGQLAYEAYCVALGAGYKTATGDALFNKLPLQTQRAWEAMAQTIKMKVLVGG